MRSRCSASRRWATSILAWKRPCFVERALGFCRRRKRQDQRRRRSICWAVSPAPSSWEHLPSQFLAIAIVDSRPALPFCHAEARASKPAQDMRCARIFCMILEIGPIRRVSRLSSQYVGSLVMPHSVSGNKEGRTGNRQTNPLMQSIWCIRGFARDVTRKQGICPSEKEAEAGR